MADESKEVKKGLLPIPFQQPLLPDRVIDEPFIAGATYFQPLPTRGVDRPTFQILNALYAKDKNLVYYRYGKVPKADPASFRVLDPGYFRETAEYSLDYPDSHGMPHFQGYARDDLQVFHYVDTIGQPSVMKGVDLETFEVLRWGYARDRKHVYHERWKIKGAKPDDFRQISKYYSTSSRTVYYAEQELVGADPASFRILRDALAVDDRRVYLYQRVIEGADPTTYEAVGFSTIGKDQARAYRMWDPIEGVDVETFEAIGGAYQKDKNRVYYLGKPIPKADPNSIRFVQGNVAEDDRRTYYAGDGRK